MLPGIGVRAIPPILPVLLLPPSDALGGDRWAVFCRSRDTSGRRRTDCADIRPAGSGDDCCRPQTPGAAGVRSVMGKSMNCLFPSNFLVSLSPVTGAVLTEVQTDSPPEVMAKVARARRAAERWRATPLKHRLATLHRLHHALAREPERIAQTLSAEIGRPLQESLGAEVLPTLQGLEFLCRKAPFLLKPTRLARPRGGMVSEPYGVIGLIGTWNYPLFLNLIPLCQALAAGNAVVWKPSELAIWSAQQTQRLLEEADLPPGVIEVVYGGAEVGRTLTQANCDKYVFTGSVSTGRAILAELARSGKPAVMELYGND